MRGALSPYDVKNVLLPMITLKFLSENEGHGFTIVDNCRWDVITSTGVEFGERLLAAFRLLEQENGILQGVFYETAKHAIPQDYISLYKAANNVLNRHSFTRGQLHDPDPLTGTMAQYTDQLWNAILSREGVGGGEIVSPRSISLLLPRLLDQKEGTVYDGTSGINEFLIEASRYARSKGGGVELYGQEINRQTRAFGIMNLILHDLYPNQAAVQLGNTITEPQWVTENGQLKLFDAVMMNAPFGVGNWGYEYVERGDPYGRFRYGIPPKSSADMAFVLHALGSLNSNGKAAMVVPNGALIRGAAEGRIRAQLLQADWIEAVIALPSNLFVGTGIPVAIMVLNKGKAEPLRGKVLLINAEEGFERVRRNQRVLRAEDIEKIVETYLGATEVDQYSKIITLDDFELNDWILTPQRYFEKAEVATRIGRVEINRRHYELSAETQRVMLKNIADISRGITPPKEDSEEETAIATHYLVNLSGVQEGKIQLDGLTALRIDHKKAEEYELEPGDILLSSRGTAMKLAVVLEDDLKDKPLIFSQNFLRIRVLKSQCDPYFIKAFLESPVGQYYLEAYQKGTAVTSLSHKDLGSIYVPLCSLERQRQIADKVRASEEAYEIAIRNAIKEQEENYLGIYGLMGIADSFRRLE
ncbi:N-6 DNA methylase [Paenibacillus sp. TRM 82003]|nr:N-6 DNA methylase [Paenibacillus sp. TRM 82003]